MDIHNSQFGADVEYDSLDRGTPAWAVKPGPGAIAPIPAVPGTTTVSENFEGALWSQITFGGGDWTVDGTQAHSPTKSFRSKVIGNNATSTFTIYNDTFDPQISFWTRYITESGFDFLTVKVDGVNALQLSGSQLSFQRHSINIGFGYQIDFVYSKDFSSAPAGDGVWIDDIVFGGLDTPAVPGSPAHALVYTPLYVDANNRLKVTLLGETIAVSGSLSIGNEIEIKNDAGNPVPVTFPRLTCATDSVEICNDAGSPITVSGTVNVGNIPHVIVDSHPAVTQGTSPWVISGAVTVSDGSGPITVDGTVTANQGTSPWVVSGTVNIGTIPEIEIKNDSGNPVPVNGTVTANQGTSPWVISGAVTVSDGSGPLTVDGTVAATQSGVWSTGRTWDLNFGVDQVDVSGSSVVADTNFDYPEDSPHTSGNPGAFILAVRNDDPLNVLTSADGDYSPIGVTSTGRVQTTDRGNFAEDTPHTSGHFGEFILAVRNDDPLNVLTDNNGDYSPISVTSTGRIFTTDRSNFAEDTAASSGHFGAFVLAVRNDTAAVKTDTDGDYSQISVDSSGRVGISDLGGSITVDGSVTVSGTVSVSNMNIQHTEDTPVVSGDIGHLVLAMRHDAGTGTVDADGDYSALHVNGFGQLKVDVGGQTINIGSLPSNTQAFPNAAITNVAASATSVTLLASNANRRKVYLTNESLSVARIAFGSAASATNYTIVLLANQTYVIEYPCYTGAMNVIWDTAVGTMRTTEVTT